MKRNAYYSDIAFVLDRSGSMKSCQQAAIDGFNQFLTDQQKTDGLVKLTLVLFDDEYLVPISSIPVEEVVSLTDRSEERRVGKECRARRARSERKEKRNV